MRFVRGQSIRQRPPGTTAENSRFGGVPPAGALGMPAFAKGCEAYHWAWAEYIQNALTQTLLIGRYLPMSSFERSQTRKKTKRKTKATAKRVTTTKTTKATRSECAPICFSG